MTESTSTGTNSIRFVLPSMPPSVNGMYNIIFSQKRVELKPEARKWKSDAKSYMPPRSFAPDSTLRVDVHFACSRFYKNGKLRVYDVSNLLKLLIDAVAERYGFNDARVWSGSWSSTDSDRERVEVVVSETQSNGDGTLTLPRLD